MTFIKDKNGQWAHPGKNTLIPDANGRITMDGVNYPVLGIDDQGNQQTMMPGGEYQFPGNDVYEIPLDTYQSKGEVIKAGKTLLSKSYKDLFTQPLPDYFNRLTEGFDLQQRLNTKGMRYDFKDFQDYRKLDFNQWRNMIDETNRIGNYGVSSDNPLTLQYFTNKSLLGNVNKQGEIAEKNLQNITSSIPSPFIKEIFGETLTEFAGSRGDGKINFDLFKQAVNEKLTPFKHVKSTGNKYANVGLDRLNVKDPIKNNTILFQSDKLGPNIVKGPGGFMSKGHFEEDNVYGHLRYYVLGDSPKLMYVLENQSDELQSLHRIPQYLKSLNFEKEYYTKLLNKEEETVALDHFNTMWSQASSPSGNLKRIGVEGGITRNSEFPLVTNIPTGNYEIKPGVKYWKNAQGYKDHFTYKQWELEGSKFPYAISGEAKPIIFNNYDEVLKFKQDFINNELAYLQWKEFGDNPAEWQRVYGDVYEGELNIVNKKIDDISSHVITDAGGNVSSEQVLRNLQKKQLQKNQSKRLFDETIIYAVDNGYKEIAFPLQSTVAKVQGYTLNEPHQVLDQPWTQEKLPDFYKYMRQLTSPEVTSTVGTEVLKTFSIKSNDAKMYGDFLFIPQNWNGTNKINHTRYELGNPILGQMDLQTSGFHNRLIEKDLPKDLTSGLYKIEKDGSYTLIPKNFNGTWHDAFTDLTLNVSKEKSVDAMATGEFKMVNGTLVPVETKPVLPEDLESIHNIISPIRDSKHKILNDGKFNLSNFPKRQQRVLNNYTLDEYLKFAKQSFGENFEYRVGVDNNGNEFFYVKPSDQWLGDKKPIKIKKHGGEMLPEYQKKGEVKEEEVTVNYDHVEKGIRHIESLDGVLMKNKESSASGLYGQLFDDIEYDGTRDEFIADLEYQKELFDKRYNGEIEGVPGLEINGIELYNEYKGQIENFSLTPTEIAALSNMLGRQGTRNYLGKVLRDGDTLEVGVPSAYGPGKPANKTPDEFLKLFNDTINTKKLGGEMKNEVISEMLQKGAFLPKFKMGAEMSLEGVIGNYVIKKNYDQQHRLPYIQFNTSDGKVRDNRVYYDKDDKDGTDNFMIIDIDEQLKHQDREHERLKTIIKKYDNNEELSFTEEKYLKEQGLIDEVQTKKQPNISLQIEPTYSGKDIVLMDINTSKDINNKTNANNDGISLAQQIEIYDAHLNNTYGECCYNKSLKVKNVYDKLNTVYYNNAKASKMTVFDYIKSLNN